MSGINGFLGVLEGRGNDNGNEKNCVRRSWVVMCEGWRIGGFGTFRCYTRRKKKPSDTLTCKIMINR